MVYIRPSAPIISPVVAVKPVGEAAHAHEDHSLANDVVVNEYLARPQIERRRKKEDRRQQRKNALLETRAGRDRRKNKPSISISI